MVDYVGYAHHTAGFYILSCTSNSTMFSML